MAAALDFYFDFTSPYGYLAAMQIDELAARHGRSVDWHPILLGPIFKATGVVPLLDVPLKGDYSRHDLMRLARLSGIPFSIPAPFPVATQHAARAVLHVSQGDAAAGRALAKALYRAYFVAGRNIGEADEVVRVAQAEGHDAASTRTALADPALKDQLRQANEAAQARGVFGSPYVIVDGEPFWGADRLPMIDLWLARGGF